MSEEQHNEQNPENPGTTPANSGTQGETPAGKIIPQEQLDKMFADRAKQGEVSGVNKLLEQLGLKTPEELTTLVTAAKKRQEDEMSEAQKLQAKLDKAEADKKAAEEKLASEQQARIQDKVNAAISAAAKGAHDANDVVLMARNQYADEVAKLVNADGVIVGDAVNKLIETIKKAKPHLFGAGSPGSPSNNNGRPPVGDEKTKAKAAQELRGQIRKGF